jgi:cobalamin biosynthetic protein CobC
LRLFTGGGDQTGSLRFGLPCDEADWQRLEAVLGDYAREYP